MKPRHLWWAVPLVLLLTACGTATHDNPTSNKRTVNNTSTSGQAANPAHTSGNSTGNSVIKNGTGLPSAHTFSTQVYVTANTYTTTSQSVVYPQLHGLPSAAVQSSLNALLKKTAIYVPIQPYTKPGSYTYSSSYNVVYEQGTIMNIVYSSYFFPTGAAHGMPAHTSLILNLKTGQIDSLNNAFEPGSNYLQDISHVVEKIDTSHALDTFQTFTGVTSKDTMFLREGGFVVDFSPYEWASFAQGFLDYYVPFSSVTKVIDTNSALWAALNDPAGFPAAQHWSEESAKIKSLGYTPSLQPEDQTTVITAQGETLTGWTGYKPTTNPAAPGTEYVFFFLNGKYLGTDTLHAHAATSNMYPDGAGTIAVTYDRYTSTGANNPFTIHYHWNGQRLVANGSFPPGFGTSAG